ncbi:glycoprotein-N-acetylgalactosamine 3-beta-galactosyltransferase 1 [Lingula anatina]|uniref:N-acetylgalactosaminide beta-1,3-galactosyltransferase n=1 Tax=Lingula anatina TaxID=7574 RepID=A0A1S3IEW0_LINAN|nr:glycoprotein-N-acetylgalactosamine 3-beta-galactosyltransferase 1 [Lingula anatina]|eukprot:XP_013396800.1 glycoprotein-N-acetylgalactosamine 3-beta-galactosyltransferase 1 [Lingula anatina]
MNQMEYKFKLLNPAVAVKGGNTIMDRKQNGYSNVQKKNRNTGQVERRHRYDGQKGKPEGVAVSVSEKGGQLVPKLYHAYAFIYKNYFKDADWFINTDDDTYVIVENLRHFLSSKNSSHPVYFGYHSKAFLEQGYFSGEGGYVFSKETLRRLVIIGGKQQQSCHQNGGEMEFEMCLSQLGVYSGDSRDELGRTRFHYFPPHMHFSGIYPAWYRKLSREKQRKGIDSISDHAVSFNTMSPNNMWAMEYYLYHLRPYGIVALFKRE